MKKPIATLLLFIGILLVHHGNAGPGIQEIELAKQYLELDINTDGMSPVSVYPDQKVYRAGDALAPTMIYVHDNGDRVIETPEGATVIIQLNGARIIELPNRRRVLRDGRGRLVWSLVTEAAPGFSLRSIGDTQKTISLSRLRGRVVILDFWAEWCAPCLPAMRELQQIQDEHGKDGLVVLGINVEEGTMRGSAFAANQFMRAAGITYTCLAGEYAQSAAFNCRQAADYRVTGIPEFVVIDKNGIVRLQKSYLTSGDREFIRDLLLEDADRSDYAKLILGEWKEAGSSRADTLRFKTNGILEMVRSGEVSRYTYEIADNMLTVRDGEKNMHQGVDLKVAGDIRILTLNAQRLHYRQRMRFMGKAMGKRTWLRVR